MMLITLWTCQRRELTKEKAIKSGLLKFAGPILGMMLANSFIYVINTFRRYFARLVCQAQRIWTSMGEGERSGTPASTEESSRLKDHLAFGAGWLDKLGAWDNSYAWSRERTPASGRRGGLESRVEVIELQSSRRKNLTIIWFFFQKNFFPILWQTMQILPTARSWMSRHWGWNAGVCVWAVLVQSADTVDLPSPELHTVNFALN